MWLAVSLNDVCEPIHSHLLLSDPEPVCAPGVDMHAEVVITRGVRDRATALGLVSTSTGTAVFLYDTTVRPQCASIDRVRAAIIARANNDTVRPDMHVK